MALTIPDVALKVNKTERLPCVLVVDGSLSMQHSGAILHLQEGLSLLEKALKADDDAAESVQIAVLRMGDENDVVELTPFTDASEFVAPIVIANGSTPLGLAVERAMEMIEDQKVRYRQNGVTFKRPWLWIMSDGEPNDVWQSVAERARVAQNNKKFVLWAVGIGKAASLESLKAFTTGDRCFKLGERDLKAMFEYMAASMSAASRGAAGTQLALPAPPTVMIPL